MNKKIALFTIAMVLLLGVTMGVTFAIMTDTSETVTNTFVAGKFGDLTLVEHVATAEENGNYTIAGNAGTTQAQSYTIVPGATLQKDPQVSFAYKENKTSGVPYYVYFELLYTTGNWVYSSASETFTYTVTRIVEEEEVDTEYASFVVADGWTMLELDGRYVFASDESHAANLTATSIIKNNTVTVNPTLSEDDLTALGDTGFQLQFIAYAAQVSGGDAASTWTAASF